MNDDAILRRVWGNQLERRISPAAPEALAEFAVHQATLRTHLGEPRWDELGGPANDSASTSLKWLEVMRWEEARVLPHPVTLRELVVGPVADVERRRDRDEAIAETNGFRLSGGLRREPWTGLRPADVCTLRLIASEGQHQIGANTFARVIHQQEPDEGITLAMIKLGEEDWLLKAVPYQLPGRLGAELLTSDPPDPELIERIRLPYPAVLAFFDQISVDALASPYFDEGLILDSAGASVDPAERGIVGVVLAADDDGRLLPWVQWLLGERVIDRGWSVGAHVGLWEHSVLAGSVVNLAAICTWGDWRPPPPSPSQVEGDEGSRAWRRSLQRSGARKAIALGALTGVHVLDVGRAVTAETRPIDSGGRHVRTHWRAGHWQNYRVATRDPSGGIIGSTRGARDVDWHYEGRWIRPTLVAAKRQDEPPTTVYRVHPILDADP